MPRFGDVSRRRARSGVALVAALALLSLAAALIVGSATAARSAMRAQSSYEAIELADSACRLAAQRFLVSWGTREDAVPIGGELGPLAATAATLGARVSTTKIKLKRLTEVRFVMVVEAEAGSVGAQLARRRLQILLERPSRTDSLVPILAPVPIARWGVTDIY